MGPRLSFAESEIDLSDYELESSVSALLDDCPSRPSFTHSPSPSASDRHILGHPHPPQSPYRFIVLVLYFVSLSFTARLVRWAAVLNQGAVLMVPIVQAGVWAGVGAVWGRCQPRGKLGGKIGIVAKGDEGKSAILLGVLTSLTMSAHLWEARTLEGRLWQALQVFVLPFALLLPVVIPARFQRHLAFHDKLPPFLYLTLIAASFLVGFALIGVPAIGYGLCIAVVRLPLEAVRVSMLKSHLGPDKVGGILVTAALVSGLCSVVTMLVLNLFSPEAHPAMLEPHHLRLLAVYTSLATLNQLLFVATVHLLKSILTPLALIIPRNMILLWASTLGRHGLPLRDNWAQMIFVLPLATLGWLLSDPEFAGTWHALRSVVNRGHHRLRPYDSVPLPDSPPTSPGQSTPAKAHRVARAAVSPFLALLPLLPLAVYLFQSPAGVSSLSTACSLLPAGVRSSLCTPKDLASALDAGTVDLVFSYYDEDMDAFREHVGNIKKVPFVADRETRVFVYNKGPRKAAEFVDRLGLTEADAVIGLANYGREGATYLEHILAHYNDTVDVLSGAVGGLAPTREGAKTFADHTFFLQPHFAWHWIAQPRLDRVRADTGFAHFGPMMKNWCGADDRGVGDYPFVKELYNMFVQDLCPPEGVLTAWSAQFVASKRRILAHPYQRYAKVAQLMEAPKEHWLHGTWGPNNSGGPSNPTFGHSLERAWPLIFGCTDPKIADTCPDDKHDREGCQCFDE